MSRMFLSRWFLLVPLAVGISLSSCGRNAALIEKDLKKAQASSSNLNPTLNPNQAQVTQANPPGDFWTLELLSQPSDQDLDDLTFDFNNEPNFDLPLKKSNQKIPPTSTLGKGEEPLVAALKNGQKNGLSNSDQQNIEETLKETGLDESVQATLQTNSFSNFIVRGMVRYPGKEKLTADHQWTLTLDNLVVQDNDPEAAQDMLRNQILCVVKKNNNGEIEKICAGKKPENDLTSSYEQNAFSKDRESFGYTPGYEAKAAQSLKNGDKQWHMRLGSNFQTQVDLLKTFGLDTPEKFDDFVQKYGTDVAPGVKKFVFVLGPSTTVSGGRLRLGTPEAQANLSPEAERIDLNSGNEDQTLTLDPEHLRTPRSNKKVAATPPTPPPSSGDLVSVKLPVPGVTEGDLYDFDTQAGPKVARALKTINDLKDFESNPSLKTDFSNYLKSIKRAKLYLGLESNELGFETNQSAYSPDGPRATALETFGNVLEQYANSISKVRILGTADRTPYRLKNRKLDPQSYQKNVKISGQRAAGVLKAMAMEQGISNAVALGYGSVLDQDSACPNSLACPGDRMVHIAVYPKKEISDKDFAAIKAAAETLKLALKNAPPVKVVKATKPLKKAKRIGKSKAKK